MSRRSTEHSADLAAIDRAALGQVIGGRISPRTTLDPVLLEGIQQLAQAIMSVGQSLAAAKQGSTQQMMQLFQQLMERRGGK
jgi:hypothetical protein